MSTHITKVVAGCFASLRQLRSRRRSLSHESFTRLAVALVVARLDYCNGVLARLPASQLSRLQSVLHVRGSATDLRRPSIRPHHTAVTAAAAASLAVCARTSDFQTLRHGVSLSAWYRPWILLGGLQARVRDLFSPATAFCLQHRRCGSCQCHTTVFTWRPRIPGRRSSSMERTAGQCHRRTIFVLIPAIPEDISVPVTTASITLITVSWSWSACTQHHVNPGELNWTELSNPHDEFRGQSRSPNMVPFDMLDMVSY